ncbi:MAG: Lin1244/Lin1753 domain-containing protein [Rhodothermales bacterium]
MQWFKHMTDMVDDPRIRRLIRKHGALGYAVYNLVIERIGKRLSTESPLPDLEETSEDMADLLNSDTAKIEEVMLTAIAAGLFDQDEITGGLLCAKMYKFLEKSQTRSKEIRAMIEGFRAGNRSVLDSLGLSETNLIEQNRTEQNRTEEKSVGEDSPSDESDDVNSLGYERGTGSQYQRLIDAYGKTRIDDYYERVLDYEQSRYGRKRYRSLPATIRNWLKRDGVPTIKDEYAHELPGSRDFGL